MFSETSSSLERSQKDEASHPDVPIIALSELGGLGPTQTQERPATRGVKLAFARKFTRTYRVTSKALLYLRGPLPKRDLDRASRFVTSSIFMN